MAAYRWWYILRDARDGLLRHFSATLATALLLAAALFLLATFLLVDQQLQGMAALLESQSKVRVFLADDADPQRAAADARTVSGVAMVEVESAETSMNRFRAAFPGGARLMDAFDRNPFPNALIIEPIDIEQMEGMVAGLQRLSAVTEVIWAQAYMPQLLDAAAAIRSAGAAGLALLLIIAFLVTTMAIHLNMLHRRDEIAIRLLVGSAPFEIRLQFVSEAILVGLAGGALGSLIGWQTTYLALAEAQRLVPLLPGPPDSLTQGALTAAGSLVGALLAAAASFAATQRSARRWESAA